MFEIDLGQSEGEWFFFQESHFDQASGEWVFDPPATDARVRLRRIEPFLRERAAQRKRVVEHVLNPKTRTMERISYFEEQSVSDAQAEMDDAWDYGITGLEYFKDKKTGKVIECTRETKLALMRVPMFDRFIGRCIRVLNGVESEQKEAEEKN